MQPAQIMLIRPFTQSVTRTITQTWTAMQTSQRIAATDAPIIVKTKRLMATAPGAVSLAQGIVHWQPPPHALKVRSPFPPHPHLKGICRVSMQWTLSSQAVSLWSQTLAIVIPNSSILMSLAPELTLYVPLLLASHRSTSAA